MFLTIVSKVKNNLIKWQFIVPVILFVVVIFMGDSPVFEDGVRQSIFYLITKYSKEDMMVFGDQVLWYKVLFQIRDFKWFVVLFPMFVSFCSATDYYNHMLSGYQRFGIIRSERKKYIIVNIVSTILLTVVTITFVYAVVTGLLIIYFPNGEISSTVFCTYLKMYLNLILVGVGSSLFVIALLEVVKDVFFALSIPMVVNYSCFMILNYHLAKLYEKYGFEYSLDYLKIEMINPVYLMTGDYEFEMLFHHSYFAFVVILIVLFSLLGGLILMAVEHRIRVQER